MPVMYKSVIMLVLSSSSILNISVVLVPFKGYPIA